MKEQEDQIHWWIDGVSGVKNADLPWTVFVGAHQTTKSPQYLACDEASLPNIAFAISTNELEPASTGCRT